MDKLGLDKFEMPLQWVVLRRLRNSMLLDSSLILSKIEGARIVGVAGPRAFGGFNSIYLLLMTLGWLTLAVPITVQLTVATERQLTLAEARSLLSGIVEESGLHSKAKARLLTRIASAKTLDGMARAIDGARE